MSNQGAVKKRPLEASNGNAQVPQNASQAKRVKKSATPSNWEVTGRYSLACTSRYQPVDASEYSMTIYHEIDDTTNTAALFGFFMFPNLNLRGVLRLCPREKAKYCSTLTEFETACYLAQGIAPSKRNQEWLLRWRGEETDEAGQKCGGETRAQSECKFKLDGAVMRVTLAMVHAGKHLIFDAHKTGAAPPPQLPATSYRPLMETEWTRLYNPTWEIYRGFYVPDWLCKEDVEASMYNHWERPRPGGIIKAKNKPGPNPGFTPAVLAKQPIGAPPAWAWDVAGTYRVKSTQLAWAFGIEPEDLLPESTEMTYLNKHREMTLTVYVDNMPHHRRTSGRQIWGHIEFGRVHGVFKLCPGSLCDVVNRGRANFAEACVLEDGIWPGPQPMGERARGMKWHGASEQGRTEDSDGWFRDHECVTEVIFEKRADEKILLNGFMMVQDKPVMLTANQGLGRAEEGKERWQVGHECLDHV